MLERCCSACARALVEMSHIYLPKDAPCAIHEWRDLDEQGLWFYAPACTVAPLYTWCRVCGVEDSDLVLFTLMCEDTW